MREQAYRGSCSAYVVSFNSRNRSIVTRPRRGTCADEVAWPFPVLQRINSSVSAFAEMKMREAHFESFAIDSYSIAES